MPREKIEKKKAKEARAQPKPAKGLPEQKVIAPPPKDNWLGWICLAGVIALSFLMSFHTLVDTDIFWHLKTGQIIFETLRVPHQDSYSFTMAGKEWIDSQWLFQLLCYLLYRMDGYRGMIVFAAVLGGLTWVLILAPALRPKKYFSIILFGFISLLCASLRLKLRPEILTFFYIALEIFLLFEFRRGKRWPLYPLPFLLLFWVNSEGLWPIYYVIQGAFLLDEILMLPGWGAGKYLKRLSPLPPRQSALRLLAAMAGSIPFTFINPYGYRGVLFPLTLLREVSSESSFIHQTISDVQSPFLRLPMLDRSIYIALIAMSAVFFLLLFYRRLFYPAALLLWAGFLFLSISALRNVALFAVTAGALSAGMIAENLDREILPLPALKNKLLRFRPAAAAVLLAAVIFFMVDVATSRFFMRNGTHARFGVGALETEYPIGGGQFLKAIMERSGKVTPLKIFADAESSAYYIWMGYPEWKLYFDPRLELYGEKFLETFVTATENPQEFMREDRKWDFDAVALTSFQNRTDLILSLYHDPQWALVYLDGFNVIFIKDQPRLASVITEHRIDFQKGFSGPMPADLTGKWLARDRQCLGYILMILGQPELALPEFEQGVKLIPEDPEMNYYLGWTLNMLQRFAEAKPYLEKSVKGDPKAIWPQIQLGRAYAMTGDTDRGLGIFRSLLERNPYELTACMDIAKVYELILKSPNASEQWQKCWEIYQSNPRAFQPQAEEISQALKRLGKMR